MRIREARIGEGLLRLACCNSGESGACRHPREGAHDRGLRRVSVNTRYVRVGTGVPDDT